MRLGREQAPDPRALKARERGHGKGTGLRPLDRHSSPPSSPLLEASRTHIVHRRGRRQTIGSPRLEGGEKKKDTNDSTRAQGHTTRVTYHSHNTARHTATICLTGRLYNAYPCVRSIHTPHGGQVCTADGKAPKKNACCMFHQGRSRLVEVSV